MQGGSTQRRRGSGGGSAAGGRPASFGDATLTGTLLQTSSGHLRALLAQRLGSNGAEGELRVMLAGARIAEVLPSCFTTHAAAATAAAEEEDHGEGLTSTARPQSQREGEGRDEGHGRRHDWLSPMQAAQLEFVLPTRESTLLTACAGATRVAPPMASRATATAAAATTTTTTAARATEPDVDETVPIAGSLTQRASARKEGVRGAAVAAAAAALGWRMVPALLGVLDDPTLKRMIQAAAAKTLHATTLPGARAAIHEYLTVLLCLALRQRRAEQAAAVVSVLDGGRESLATEAVAATAARRGKSGDTEGGGGSTGGMKRTGSVVTFASYDETQWAVEAALRGHVSGGGGSGGSSSAMAAAAGVKPQQQATKGPIALQGLYSPAWALAACVQWHNARGAAVLHALQGDWSAAVRCQLRALTPATIPCDATQRAALQPVVLALVPSHVLHAPAGAPRAAALRHIAVFWRRVSGGDGASLEALLLKALAYEGVSDALALLLDEAAAAEKKEQEGCVQRVRADGRLFAATAFSPVWHLHVCALSSGPFLLNDLFTFVTGRQWRARCTGCRCAASVCRFRELSPSFPSLWGGLRR